VGRFATWMLCAGLLAAPSVAAEEFSRAPNIEMISIWGQKTRIDYKSARVTLVNFWATWCGPCREEMPMIAKLFKRLGPQGLQAVGIAVESGGPEEVKKFFSKIRFGLNYEILIGGDDALAGFGDVGTVPTTYLFDSSGRLLKTYTGVIANFQRKVEDEIEKHLAAAAPPPAGKAAGTP